MQKRVSCYIIVQIILQIILEKVGVCYANTLPNAKLPEEYQSYRALYIIFVFVLSLIIVISSVWIVLRVRRNRFYGKMSKVSNYGRFFYYICVIVIIIDRNCK